MNYIDQINGFWATRRSKRITNVQADLYYYLLNESSSRGNGSNWENPFKCSNGLIMAGIGIAKSTLQDARNGLQQAGLIEVEAGQKNKENPEYFIKELGESKADKRPYKRSNNRLTTGLTTGQTPDHYKEETKRNETETFLTPGKPVVVEKKEDVALTDTIAPPKNPSAAKKEKSGAKKETRPFWDGFIATFDKAYSEKHKGEVFELLDRDFPTMANIYDLLLKRAKRKEKEWTEAYMIDSFKFFLNRAFDYLKGFSIAGLFHQFNNIYNGSQSNRPTPAGAGKISDDGGY